MGKEKKFIIPNCFISEKYKYFHLSSMLKFCRSNGIKIDDILRDSILNAILKYGTKKANVVNKWVDKVLKEGIKHIYITKINISEEINNMINSENGTEIINYISSKLNIINKNQFILEYDYSKETEPELISFNYDRSKFLVELKFCITLFQKDRQDNVEKIKYPIFIDIDLGNNLVIGRAKSITGLYIYSESDKFHDEKKIKTKELIIGAITKSLKTLNISINNERHSKKEFKNKLFEILDKFTFTPKKIEDKIKSCEKKIKDFVEDIIKTCKINVQSVENIKNAEEDLTIFIEKHISINLSRNEQKIFTNRKAYPIKIGITSLDNVKVEESSAREEPLQCTSAYYDNKKSTILKKMCDCLSLCFKRIETIYFGTKPYTVKFSIINGYAHFAFPEYIEEEDIQNVLSYFIDHNR